MKKPKVETIEAGDNNKVVASVTPQPDAQPKTYKANIFQNNFPEDAEFIDIINGLEKALKMKLWLFIQDGEDEKWNEVGHAVYKGFLEHKEEIKPGERVGLLIHSPGGDASCAYRIIRLFQRRTKEFYTVVPLYAKSAATLMAVGGKKIIMGAEAELGPLDVQMWDYEKDQYDSALNAVQSFERINAYALTAFDNAMQLLIARMRKRPDMLMPQALAYATDIVTPLLQKIDTIDLTKKSRELKVAEDYAIRLMKQNYPEKEYIRIARALVENYSTHGFVVDRIEAGKAEGQPTERMLNLGLHIASLSPEDENSKEVEKLLTRLIPYLNETTVIGRIVEEKHGRK